jgi:hypothetical protein
MGKEADLGEQAQGKGNRDRQECRLPEQRSPRRRHVDLGCDGGWLTAQEPPGKRTDDGDRRDGYRHRRQGQARACDQGGPKRREQQAADAGAIEGGANRLRSVALEPRHHHGVDCDCRAAHGRPSCTTQHKCRDQLPGLLRARPGDGANRREHCSGERDPGHAEAAIGAGQA